MKHEITELALIEPPPELRELGITVMDGMFFSIMRFPALALALHNLSYVRYAPHESWSDMTDGHRNPYELLAERSAQPNALYMLRDAQRYLPAIVHAKHLRSLYEVKTILCSNETDDGRPILYRDHHWLRNLHLIMGGTIHNIYDVLKYLHHNVDAP